MALVYHDITAAAANTSTLNAMLASQKVLELGEGELFHAGTIQLSKNGNKLRSPGLGALKFTNTNGAAHSINTAVGLGDIEISGCDIGWAPGVVTTSNVCGINTDALEYAQILNNRIFGAGIGVALRSTGYGHFKGNVMNSGKNAGVYMSQCANYPQLQWVLEDNICQTNASHGYFVYANPGLPVPQLNLGDWINNRTFNNAGQGIAIIGCAAVPIQGVRILGGFIGQDQAGEVYLDTYGTNHVIRGLYAEVSQAGSGIIATASNGNLDISHCEISGMAGDGISTAAADTLITGVRSVNNGLGPSGGYGFRFADSNKVTITGCVTRGNHTGPVAAGINPSLLAGAGNKFA